MQDNKRKLIASIVGIGEALRFKIIMTISTIMGQLPVFHKLKLDEFADFIDKSGFNILEKERIKDEKDMMALLYIKSEGIESKIMQRLCGTI